MGPGRDARTCVGSVLRRHKCWGADATCHHGLRHQDVAVMGEVVVAAMAEVRRKDECPLDEKGQAPGLEDDPGLVE